MHDPQLYFKVERLQNKVDELEARILVLENQREEDAEAIRYANMLKPFGGAH